MCSSRSAKINAVSGNKWFSRLCKIEVARNVCLSSTKEVRPITDTPFLSKFKLKFNICPFKVDQVCAYLCAYLQETEICLNTCNNQNATLDKLDFG